MESIYMDMRSFVASIGELFLMDTNKDSNFDSDRKKYVIPKYQREYKWTKEKVRTLISDINNRDKFLGNVILNKISDYYEIVDGQQRITTIMLILLALFNKNKPATGITLSEEQGELVRYIYRDNGCYPVLENESVGDYLHLEENKLEINIEDSADIYYQKKTFDDLYQEIDKALDDVADIMKFQKKVLDCQVLVLIGDTGGRQNDSIEEVFLDINFKSQLLDVADIFKGYCFKNYASSSHKELKNDWTKVRKYIKEFEAIGYQNNDTCEYIYHYLLSRPDTYRIPADLSNNGKHYLEDKTHSETKSLLLDMVSYGEHITEFIKELNDNTYIFDDICADADNYRTDVINQQMIKNILKTIMLNNNVQYYKFPLFMVIHYLMKNQDLRKEFSYQKLKQFVTDYYAYTFFFINGRRNKNKTAIDQTIFNELYKIDSGEKASDVVCEILKATSELVKIHLEEYRQFEVFAPDKAYALYSFMDNYSAIKNYINCVYSFPNYNKEHLLAHNNDELEITWEEDGNQFTFSLKQLLGKPNGRTYIAKKYRDSTAKYIIIPSGLNTKLGQKDIVEKIRMIENYYDEAGRLPNHVYAFLTYIKSMEEYKVLSELKGQARTHEEIEAAYKTFIVEYFSEENQHALYDRLEKRLKRAFKRA